MQMKCLRIAIQSYFFLHFRLRRNVDVVIQHFCSNNSHPISNIIIFSQILATYTYCSLLMELNKSHYYARLQTAGIWAASWQNQQNDCVPSEDSDQPGHSPSLIRVFAVRMKKACFLSYPLSAQRRLWSDWTDAQADVSLRCAYMPFCWLWHEAAHLTLVLSNSSERWLFETEFRTDKEKRTIFHKVLSRILTVRKRCLTIWYEPRHE